MKKDISFYTPGLWVLKSELRRVNLKMEVRNNHKFTNINYKILYNKKTYI